MARLTTGPLYIEPKYRDCEESFLLLISNMSGLSASVNIEVYAAAFTAANTPETWIPILTQTVTVPDDTVFNRIMGVQNYPYWIFTVESLVTPIHPSLYLLKSLTNAVQDFPLVPTGDWVLDILPP
jgi:hypothetical protein